LTIGDSGREYEQLREQKETIDTLFGIYEKTAPEFVAFLMEAERLCCSSAFNPNT